MRRASFIVIVPALALLLAVWTIPVSAQETAPPAKADAAAAAPAAKDAPKEIPEYNEAVNLFRNRERGRRVDGIEESLPEASGDFAAVRHSGPILRQRQRGPRNAKRLGGGREKFPQ